MLSEMPIGFGHPILNPFGVVIKISRPTLTYLSRFRYLRRDRQSGLLQIRPERVKLFLELERNGLEPQHYVAIGRDFLGPMVVRCRCRDCEGIASDIDHTRPPGPNILEQDATAAIVKEIKKRRKKHRG
jgi:hypothetical protein